MTKSVKGPRKVIIKCPQCKQKLRLPLLHNKELTVRCMHCYHQFSFDCKKYAVKQAAMVWGIGALCIIVLLADFLFFPVMGRHILNIVTAEVRHDHEQKLKKMEMDFPNEISMLNKKYAEEIAKVDRDNLRDKAAAYYAREWEERKNYDSKYAITPREKAQLEMLTLAKDKTRPLEEMVEKIAIRAAPRNSEVNAYTTPQGIRLDINFDMSELTSGEEGIWTKHTTINSLKKEVVTLISKVTNDVYQFCQDLDLASISIGCKHFVSYEVENGSLAQKNTVLYKVRLDRESIKKLEHNPFLDTYSTTRYFEVEIDDFPNLTIETERFKRPP